MFRCTMTINYGEDKTPLMKVNFMTVDVQLSHQVVTKLQNGGHCCRLKHLRVTPGVVLIHLGIICGKNLYHHNKVRPLSLNVISILKGNRLWCRNVCAVTHKIINTYMYFACQIPFRDLVKNFYDP